MASSLKKNPSPKRKVKPDYISITEYIRKRELVFEMEASFEKFTNNNHNGSARPSDQKLVSDH